MNFSFRFGAADSFLFFLNMYLLSAPATWLRIIETIATNYVLCLEDFPSYTVSIYLYRECGKTAVLSYKSSI